MADAGILKNMNVDTIRSLLHKHSTMSKSEIARITGLSFPTVSRAVEDLISSGELIEKGHENSTGGRRAQIYSINPLFSVSLLLRLEGYELHWSINDLGCNCLDSGILPCKNRILHIIDTLIGRVQARYPQLGAIVIGVSGIVNQGIVTSFLGYEELRGVNLLAHFYNKFKIATAVENDIKTAAAGYWAHHENSSFSITVCIYLGQNGIGASTIMNGTVWRGASEFAGELHYLPISDNNLDYAKYGFNGVDMVDYYGKIIRSYAALVNPSRIVLYENAYISEKIDDIRRNCSMNLPVNSIPQIELSSQFIEDYEKGLASIANSLQTQSKNNRNFIR